MARWIGEVSLSIGGGKMVFHGETIPAGALAPERFKEFCDKGDIDPEDASSQEPVAPVEKPLSVNVRAPKVEPLPKPKKAKEKLVAVPKKLKKAKAKPVKVPKKPKKKRGRKKKDGK